MHTKRSSYLTVNTPYRYFAKRLHDENDKNTYSIQFLKAKQTPPKINTQQTHLNIFFHGFAAFVK